MLTVGRGLKTSRKVISRPLLMCGRCSQLLLQNIAISCSRVSTITTSLKTRSSLTDISTQVSSHNAAFRSCHIYLPASETSSASISSPPYQWKYPTKFSAFSIQHRCAKQLKSANDGGPWQMMMWYGIGCASSISIESVQSVAGVYQC